MPQSHQTFRSIQAVKLLGIMSRNRWWPIIFSTITPEMSIDGVGTAWCDRPLKLNRFIWNLQSFGNGYCQRVWQRAPYKQVYGELWECHRRFPPPFPFSLSSRDEIDLVARIVVYLKLTGDLKLMPLYIGSICIIISPCDALEGGSTQIR